MLPIILRRSTKMQVADIVDGMSIKRGVIYTAAPDQHLLIRSKRIQLTRGPKENGNRPSIDVLFRSAAMSCGPRVVGVVLSGTLDDGTAGLSVIKEFGGITIVQDPLEAAFPGMPLSAVQNVAVDHVLPAVDIAACLLELVNGGVVHSFEPDLSPEQKDELREAQDDMDLIEPTERVGIPSVYSCPDCNGVLWEVIDGDVTRYRCRTGHAFSEESLLAGQSDAVESALWTAVRALEERRDLAVQLSERSTSRGYERAAKQFKAQAAEAARQAQLIRDVLAETSHPISDTKATEE